MKVLHVITSLRMGGAEKLMVDLLPKMKNIGNDIELCVFDGVDTAFMKLLKYKGIIIHICRVGGSVYDVRNIQKLCKLMKGFDIVHTHNTSPQLFAAIAKMLSGSKAKLVTTEHNTSNRRRGNVLLGLGDRWMYKQYDKVICISEKAEENLREWIKDDSDKICTIFNGINYDTFANAEPVEDIVNAFNGMHVGVMVSAFRPQKDHKTAIRAYKLLPGDYHLLLAGRGEIQEEIKQFVKDEGMVERVHFLGARTDVQGVLKSVDAVILSSHYEGLSLSSLEGMASGKPFIASDVNGLHEIVDGYGLLFPHEDAVALAECIKKVTEDKEYAQQVATSCQKRAAQFDISVMAEKYNEVYREMMNL